MLFPFRNGRRIQVLSPRVAVLFVANFSHFPSAFEALSAESAQANPR